MTLSSVSSNHVFSSSNSSVNKSTNTNNQIFNDALGRLESAVEKPSPRSSSRSRSMISCGALVKKFLWGTMMFTLPVESGRKLVNLGEKFLKQSEGYAGILGNKTHNIVNTDGNINDLALNDPFIKETESQYAVTSQLHARLVQTANSGSVVQHGDGPAKQDLQSSIAQNLFERQMLYKYQRAVMYETHLATHMANYEISRYASQIEGLEETVTQLRIEAAKNAERINALESQVTTVTNSLIELLDLSKAVHGLAKRACEVLLSIPLVKNIDFIKTICDANDRLGEGVGKLDGVYSTNPQRKLTQEDIDSLKVNWNEADWPKVQFWIDKLIEYSANAEDNPDFISPGLPEPKEAWPHFGSDEGGEIALDNYRGKMIEEIYHLGNFTQVVDHSATSANALATQYVDKVDALMRNESISLYEQLTGSTNTQSNAQERMNHLKDTLRNASDDELKEINTILGNVGKELNNRKSSITQRVYLFSTLAALTGIFAIIQSTRICSKNKSPLIGARSAFNNRYTEVDNPGLARNKITAKNMLKASSYTIQNYFSQMEFISEDEESAISDKNKNDKKDELSSFTNGIYAKVATNRAIRSLPEFLATSGIVALVLSSLAANAMDGHFDILERGDKDLNNQLKTHGNKILGVIDELYEKNDRLAAATQTLQSDLLTMENKYIAHQELLNGKIQQLDMSFVAEHEQEYPWIESAISNPLLNSVIADRSKNRDLESQFAAFDITKMINSPPTDSILSNATDFLDTTSTNSSTQTPHEKAQAHYADGSDRLDGKLGGLDAKVGDNFLFNALLVSAVFTLFILRKVDAETTHPQDLAENDMVRTDPTCEDHILPCLDEKEETRNLAELLGGLQLYLLRTRNALPAFLQPIEKTNEHSL